MSRWFRFYDDAINDPKILKLPDASRWHWTALLCIASKHDGALPSTDDVALMLRVKPAAAAAIIAQMKQAGLLDLEDGKYTPHNWNGRQYKTDTKDPTGASRSKNYRDRKRGVTRDDRDGNACRERPEAEQIQITEQNRPEARDELQKRVGDFRQAVVRVYSECNSIALPETSRCTIWLSQGFDPEICLAVIAEILRKKPSISSLSYFDRPIEEAHAKRAPPRKTLSNEAIPPDWEAAAKLWKSVKRWPKGYGNDPDSPACRAPAEILRKHGIELTGASHG